MRVTVFSAIDGGVRTEVTATPAWQLLEEYDGNALRGVRLTEVLGLAYGDVQLVEIAAGGYFAMHTSADSAFCQIVSGRGRLFSWSITYVTLLFGAMACTRAPSSTCSGPDRCTTGTTWRRTRFSPCASCGSAAGRS